MHDVMHILLCPNMSNNLTLPVVTRFLLIPGTRRLCGGILTMMPARRPILAPASPQLQLPLVTVRTTAPSPQVMRLLRSLLPLHLWPGAALDCLTSIR